MSKQIASINVASNQTFQYVFTQINEIIDTVNTYVITTDVTANGGLTTGNAFVNGIFSANVLKATTIRGGNVQSNTALTIDGNVSFTANVAMVRWAIDANNYANSTGVFASKFKTGNNELTSNSLILNGTTYTSLATALAVNFAANAIANVGTLTFIQGNSTELTLTHNAGANSVEITIGVSANAGLGTAGANTTVQFNDSGVFGGNASFTYNKSTSLLSAPNVAVSKLYFDFVETKTFANNYSSASPDLSTPIVVDSYPFADFVGGEYIISAKYTAANDAQVSKIIVTNQTTTGNSSYTEFAHVATVNTVAEMNVTSNATHIILTYTPKIGNTQVRGQRTLFRNV